MPTKALPNCIVIIIRINHEENEFETKNIFVFCCVLLLYFIDFVKVFRVLRYLSKYLECSLPKYFSFKKLSSKNKFVWKNKIKIC